MKFKLTIEMGNEAMSSCSHVRRALIAVTNQLQRQYDHRAVNAGDEGKIRDENGNTVGRWRFKEDT